MRKVYTNDLLSIVIITCNREKELKRAIDSCITFADMNCEIIIVDNNSSDNTKEMLNKIITPPHIKIRPFFMNSNLGVAGARNYGFNMARSRVVFFLDDDAYFDDNSKELSYAYDYMLKNNGVFAIATEIYDLKEKCLLRDIGSRENPNNVFSFIGASHFIRKDYVTTKHLYPEKLFYGCEELFACICAYNQGYYVEYNPHIKVIHNPSLLTRANEFEINLNILINKFVVKKLTLPRALLAISMVMFYLRIVKLCKFCLRDYGEGYNLYKKRFKENRYATNRMGFNRTLQLIKSFGIYRLL
ncbi:putative glycosyltransferase [Desulfosporosinus meridiei DSM 13257]|uniref:Putative glycosyltransferase n=1 Tax=Desulfosporosinus meridiei (strain ATCC BAA-275 / DSM 13257 / KCTC 12902 / NCIMB 13706 / S10) TaxID=768704 RepID=J7J3X5_DESMD|nr:putative glycosyltransferase [Desulfosporosinus meridiei DSM 13257]